MFEVIYRSSKKRVIQHGIRDLEATKWKCFCKAFGDALKSFCTTSSFAPLRFAFERRSHKFDVFLWISITITLLVLTTTFVEDFLIKFDSMSTTTIVKTNQRSTSFIPFPSVTVCATSRFSYTKVYGFMHNYIIKNPALRASVNLTKILKSFTLIDATQNDLDEMDIVLNANNITMKDVFYYTSQSCDELFQLCRWQGEIRPCNQLFKRVFGAGSFCCSFNYPLPPSVLKTRKFFKTNSYGSGKGLSFIARPLRDRFYYRSDYGSNLRVILHHFLSFPSFDENEIYAPLGKETYLNIESVYNTADEKVRKLPIAARDCVFGWELELEHFPVYSYSNCILDCQVSRIIRACGCATYFYPSVNTSICPTSKLFCNIINRNLDIKTNLDGTISVENCYCPDDCIVLKIHYSVLSTDFIVSNYTVDEFYKNISELNGIVHINFSKSFTRLLQRKLILDELQLASNVGGIIALFLGCSLISIFEIIYFLSIRMFKNYRRLCIQNLLVETPSYLD